MRAAADARAFNKSGSSSQVSRSKMDAEELKLMEMALGKKEAQKMADAMKTKKHNGPFKVASAPRRAPNRGGDDDDAPRHHVSTAERLAASAAVAAHRAWEDLEKQEEL
jgi:hypothetical protein